MNVNERMIDYLNSLDGNERAEVQTIKKQALADRVPIIRQETGSLLKLLLTIKKPKRILEIGTAVGFSAVLMSDYMPEDAHITTIEKYEKRIPVARANIEMAGRTERITLLEGDALEVMAGLKSQDYDFIFMDAAKGQYLNFLPEMLRLLKKDGLLISDNVLQDGHIIESRYAVTRRDRTIHSRMRDYLWELKHMNSLQTTILPIGDGVSISAKLV